MAAYYPEKPSASKREETRQFLHLISRLYPCGYCADRTADEMEVNPPRLNSQKEFSEWMCEIHNEVNYRMNKPLFDCSKVGERWKTGAPGICGPLVQTKSGHITAAAASLAARTDSDPKR